MYLNVGARYNMGKVDIPTKKALKQEYQDNPSDLMLYGTGMNNEGKEYKSDELEIGVKYTVVGPNPYTSRKWYATVEKLPNGTITVK